MASLILLAIFVPIVLISAIYGLVRGLNKAVVRLMFIAVTALLTFLIAGPVSTLIANSIVVEGQSLGELILSAMNADGALDSVLTAAPLLKELILVLPAFAVAIVLFPVMFYVLKFITWIVFVFTQKPLRKLIFKDNCDKEEYKAQPTSKRMISRFSGLGVGIVTGMIIFGMIMTPFFGVLAMMPSSDSVNDMINYMVEFGEMTPDDAGLVKEVYATTDAGLVKFYGFFGAKAAGKAYLNGVTRVEADGVSTNLGNEMDSLVSLLQTLVKSGMLNDSDPNAIYALLADKDKLDSLMQDMFQSKILCAALPDLMAMAMGEIAGTMNVPADKNAVYDNMMEEVALTVRTAEVDYQAIAAYEAANGSRFSLLPIGYFSNLTSTQLMTQEEYEAEIEKLVELAEKISSLFNTSLSGDNKAFTDSVAAHIVETVKNGGQDAAANLDAQTVTGVISNIDASSLEGDADLLGQLTDKEQFKTDVVTVEDLSQVIRETVRAAVADESAAKETASALASVVSDFAGAVSNATDEEGNLDMTKVDFEKIGSAITTLQNSSLKGVGSCVLDMVASADQGGMLGNVMQAVKEGYENGEDVGGTIGTAGALINLGNAMGDENNPDAMVDSLTGLIRNLNEFTISLLPTIFSEDTVTSMGIPAEYADATYKLFETLLTELMKLKDAEDYDNEVNAILELYNLATSGTENFDDNNLARLFDYANKSDAIYNTLVSISTSNPFGIKIEDAAARQDLADAIAEVYHDSGKTARDQDVARALAALLGVDAELKLN